MRELYNSNRDEYEQPVKPYVDTSAVLYFSDGTVSTVAREQRLARLQEDRQRNLNADPERVAFWLNGLAMLPSQPTFTLTDVVAGLDLSLARIEAHIQANMPTTQ